MATPQTITDPTANDPAKDEEQHSKEDLDELASDEEYEEYEEYEEVEEAEEEVPPEEDEEIIPDPLLDTPPLPSTEPIDIREWMVSSLRGSKGKGQHRGGVYRSCSEVAPDRQAERQVMVDVAAH